MNEQTWQRFLLPTIFWLVNVGFIFSVPLAVIWLVKSFPSLNLG